MKIEKLTKEQEARIPEFREKWLMYGLSTAPTDRELAEEGIREAYQAAGLPAPKYIYWGSSPFATVLTRSWVIAILQGFKNIKIPQVWAQVGDQIGDQVRDQVRDHM